MASRLLRPHLAPLVSLLGVALASTLATPAALAGSCEFLSPVGGDGVSPIVTKTIGMGNPLGRPNWNTDFYVTKPYSSYKLFFTADSSKSATYPVEAYLKFTDGSNLRVFNANIAPEPGTGGGKDVPAATTWPPPASPTGCRCRAAADAVSDRDAGASWFGPARCGAPER